MDAPDCSSFDRERDLTFLARVKRADLDELERMWRELEGERCPEDWKREALARAFAREVAR